MTQPPLFDAPESGLHDLWGGKRLSKEEFEHLFHDDPKTIRGLAAIRGVGEYIPPGADEDSWWADNVSYTNDQMYKDLNHVLRVNKGLPDEGDFYDRMNKQEGPYKNVHSEPDDILNVIDGMDVGHKNSRMHGITALHRGVKDVVATFGEEANGSLTGKEFVEHAPLSTSPSSTVASSFRRGRAGDEPAHIHILAPRGTPALSTVWHGDKENGGSVDAGESEVILGRGGRYHIVHDEDGTYHRNIYAQYIGPNIGIHGKADLDNLKEHDPEHRMDLNMPRLRDNAAKAAAGDDYDKLKAAGYDHEVTPTDEGTVHVKFHKLDENRGVAHEIDYKDIDPHEKYPAYVESTVRPIRNNRGSGYVRGSHTKYMDGPDDNFDAFQAHLNEHPDDSYFRKEAAAKVDVHPIGPPKVDFPTDPLRQESDWPENKKEEVADVPRRRNWQRNKKQSPVPDPPKKTPPYQMAKAGAIFALAQQNDWENKDYYHGTTAEDLDEVSPANHHGHGTVFPNETDPDYAYATPDESTAWHYAELAWNAGHGDIPRVYRVRPTGPVEEDPTHRDGVSRGNFSDDVRSRHPFEVYEELPTPEHWQEGWGDD